MPKTEREYGAPHLMTYSVTAQTIKTNTRGQSQTSATSVQADDKYETAKSFSNTFTMEKISQTISGFTSRTTNLTNGETIISELFFSSRRERKTSRTCPTCPTFHTTIINSQSNETSSTFEPDTDTRNTTFLTDKSEVPYSTSVTFPLDVTTIGFSTDTDDTKLPTTTIEEETTKSATLIFQSHDSVTARANTFVDTTEISDDFQELNDDSTIIATGNEFLFTNDIRERLFLVGQPYQSLDLFTKIVYKHENYPADLMIHAEPKTSYETTEQIITRERNEATTETDAYTTSFESDTVVAKNLIQTTTNMQLASKTTTRFFNRTNSTSAREVGAENTISDVIYQAYYDAPSATKQNIYTSFKLLANENLKTYIKRAYSHESYFNVLALNITTTTSKQDTGIDLGATTRKQRPVNFDTSKDIDYIITNASNFGRLISFYGLQSAPAEVFQDKSGGLGTGGNRHQLDIEFGFGIALGANDALGNTHPKTIRNNLNYYQATNVQNNAVANFIYSFSNYQFMYTGSFTIPTTKRVVTGTDTDFDTTRSPDTKTSKIYITSEEPISTFSAKVTNTKFFKELSDKRNAWRAECKTDLSDTSLTFFSLTQFFNQVETISSETVLSFRWVNTNMQSTEATNFTYGFTALLDSINNPNIYTTINRTKEKVSSHKKYSNAYYETFFDNDLLAIVGGIDYEGQALRCLAIPLNKQDVWISGVESNGSVSYESFQMTNGSSLFEGTKQTHIKKAISSYSLQDETTININKPHELERKRSGYVSIELESTASKYQSAYNSLIIQDTQQMTKDGISEHLPVDAIVDGSTWNGTQFV